MFGNYTDQIRQNISQAKIKNHFFKHKNTKITLKNKLIIIDMLEKDLLKSEKLVGKHERVIIALQEEITLLKEDLLKLLNE